jgi:hypothetical protein
MLYVYWLCMRRSFILPFAAVLMVLVISCRTTTSEAKGDNSPSMSVSPNSGRGRSQVFTANFRKTPDGPPIKDVRLLVNSAVDGRNACYIYADAEHNTLSLVNDSGIGSTAVKLPNGGSAENSQCTVQASGSQISPDGTGVTVRFAITFKEPFRGDRQLLLFTSTGSGSDTGLQPRGKWSVE